MDKQFTVRFEHKEEFLKVSVEGVFASNAESAIAIARETLAEIDNWICVSATVEDY